MYRKINATTATRNSSGTPCVYGEHDHRRTVIFEHATSVIPKPRSGKLTLKAVADRKFSN